ncbi:hypothetical protein GPECTOR_74g680 [Gonium pectorale]|uniref:Uncharacterized protein n=1 Tax=Gonium pectorale TaxID=33097 RepID=A0A150G2G8_GONPE|nr:hypothetical protein GPECTOR_74g680 [Gonium pectorale]|eukprot:KXZ44066.1 hypothetical protein GPECTOR_74g680 [Gonium pectorale]
MYNLPGCVNVGGTDGSSVGAGPVPPERRCWAQLGVFNDTALLAYDLDINQNQVPG